MLKSRVILPVALLAIAAASSRAMAEDADEAVRKVLKGLEQHQAQVLWQALPASYQADVTELVHGMAANADLEVWNGAFRVLGKLVRVLDEKRAFIQENPLVASKLSETEGSGEVYDAVVKLLSTLTTSELSDLDRMRQLDLENFFGGTVSQLMVQLEALGRLSPDSAREVEEFRTSEVILVSQEGDNAVVRVVGGEERSDDGDDGEDAEEGQEAATDETKMTRVEGKWIPADMAMEWKDKVEEMRVQLTQLPGRKDALENEQILLTMGQVESGLDRLLATETADEFNQAAQAFVGQMMFQFAGAMSGGAEEEEDPGNQ